jgi:hypothetical protein
VASVWSTAPMREQPLDKYLNDPNVRGLAFLFGSDSFLQLHLFPNEFTLFWPSEINGYQAPPTIFTILSAMTSAGARNASGWFDQAMVSMLVPGSHGLTERKEQFDFANRPISTMVIDIEQFLAKNWNSVVSFHAEFSSRQSSEKFGIWSDTSATPIFPRETGITASYGTLKLSATY